MARLESFVEAKKLIHTHAHAHVFKKTYTLTQTQTADNNFMTRLESFLEAKKLMNAALDPQDPLNIQDYEPPHEQVCILMVYVYVCDFSI